MSNILTLPGIREPAHGTPCAELIDVLRDLLAMAEAGELQSFIGTGLLSDGSRLTAWSDTHQNYYEQLGSLVALKDEYTARHPT